MPLPLLWIGAAIASGVALSEVESRRKKQDLRRANTTDIESRGNSHRHDSGVAKYPTEVFSNEKLAIVRPGAVVCCGLGGILEHTGILIDDDTIVELHGSGLIKAISPERFLKERSGSEIFVACDSQGEAIADELTCQRAVKQIYTYQEYGLIDNNCHRFVWQCINGRNDKLTSFHELNKNISKRFDRKIYWDKWQR
ncbi:hypothetical protein [Thalassotalea crassostreae]|uniref:hypothetical protein n=1 Tax=Thalassotalea crassostreae TaxID=1763536 RepID=UPI000838633D|nr:hypothetical protein [Thalassotalea crassostreae]